MINILFGAISGFVSSMGMRRRNGFNFSANYIWWNRATFGTRY